MENASKALEIAAGVLLSVLIISALFFMFTKFSETKQTQRKAEEESQSVDFNLQYEEYENSKLYGTNIISIFNKMINYNRGKTEENEYEKITMEVKIIIGSENIPQNNKYTQDTLYEKYNNLAYKIVSLGKIKYGMYTVNEWAKQGSNSISSSLNSSQINQVNKYKSLCAEQANFTRKKFSWKESEKNSKGRIVKMIFEEYE